MKEARFRGENMERRNMMMLGCFTDRSTLISYARRHKEEKRDNLAKKAEELPDSEVLNKRTEMSVELHRRARQVGDESGKLKAFVRLEPIGSGVLFAAISSEHDVLESVANHFCARFPTFAVAIYGNGKLVFRSRGRGGELPVAGKEAAREWAEKELRGEERAEGLVGSALGEWSEDLWKTFYAAQFVEQRRSRKRMLAHMPKKYMQRLGMRFEERLSLG